MAEFATIARPYAEGLFKACEAQPAAALAWLEPMAAAAAQPALQQFAANPKTLPTQVFDLIAEVLGGALDAVAGNFLRTVIANDRLAYLPTIAALYRARVDACSGVSEAVVYSAFDVDAAALEDLRAVLERRFGRSLKLRVERDAALIGGVRVVVGDEVLDTSVKARLEQMKVALTA